MSRELVFLRLNINLNTRKKRKIASKETIINLVNSYIILIEHIEYKKYYNIMHANFISSCNVRFEGVV